MSSPYFRAALAATLVLPAGTAASAQSESIPVAYEIDASHSAIDFSARFMGLSTVHGGLGEWVGTLMLDKDTPRSSITVVINTASLNTNSATRDKDLRSENFF